MLRNTTETSAACLHCVTINGHALSKVVAVDFAFHDSVGGKVLPLLVVSEDKGSSRTQGRSSKNAVVACIYAIVSNCLYQSAGRLGRTMGPHQVNLSGIHALP